MSDDGPTARLGAYLAIGFGAQLLFHLLGVSGGRARIELIHPVLIILAVLLARGVRPARTALLIGTWAFGMLASFLMVIAFTTVSVVAMVLSSLLVGLAAGQMVALAFTVPEAGLAGGVPEAWRPWATSEWLHLTLLLAGLVAAVAA
ncbi:MAG: hypothetical protein ACRD1K_00420 [Acidimicrobiales bacterium]